MTDNTLYEYEIAEADGTTTTVQLTEADAEKIPGAQKIGGEIPVEPSRREDEGGTTKNAHDVQNRARRSK